MQAYSLILISRYFTPSLLDLFFCMPFQIHGDFTILLPFETALQAWTHHRTNVPILRVENILFQCPNIANGERFFHGKS